MSWLCPLILTMEAMVDNIILIISSILHLIEYLLYMYIARSNRTITECTYGYQYTQTT